MFVLLGLPGFIPTGRSDEKMLNVLSFCARGDGVTLNTSFIQAAIDSATAMGGGVVVDHSKYEHESLKAAFPEGDIGFLNSIAPIGTRFQNPSLLGPESQKSIQLNYGIIKGTLWFDFR